MHTEKNKWPSDAEFRTLKLELALDFAPSIGQCQKCGYPYISGYCCTECGDPCPDTKEPNWVYYVPKTYDPDRPLTIPKGAEQRHKAVQGEHPWGPCTMPPDQWYTLSYKMEFRWPK